MYPETATEVMPKDSFGKSSQVTSKSKLVISLIAGPPTRPTVRIFDTAIN